VAHILPVGSEDHEARVLTGRIDMNVREIQIEGHQDSPLPPAYLDDHGIWLALQTLGVHGFGVVIDGPEDISELSGRFSSTLNLIRQLCPWALLAHGRVPPRRLWLPGYPPELGTDRPAVSPRARPQPQGCPV
jgi:hypothetical protein